MTELVSGLVADYGGLPLLAGAAAFLIGGIVKGGLGFGMPLVTISLLPLVLPVDLALAANMVVLVITNVYQYVVAGRMGETLNRFWPVLVGLALGVPIGASFLASVSPVALTIALGVFIVLFVILTAANPKLTIPRAREPMASAFVGIAAGVIGPLTSTPGPIFASFLLGTGVDRRMMLSALGLFLVVLSGMTSGAFWFLGVLDPPRLVYALGCLPGVIVGMWFGNLLADRLPAATFRKLVMAVLFGLGVYLIIRSL